MKIMVTGANGFVGSALCPLLIESGHEVVAAVRARGSAPAGTHEVLLDDASPLGAIKTALNDVDAVVHLAARVHVMRDESDDPDRDFARVNSEWTVRLAEAAAGCGVKRFVFLSSIKVNGEGGESAYSVWDLPSPDDPYGRSKWDAEQRLRQVFVGADRTLVVIRTPLVYGPGVGGNFARMLSIVHKRLPLPLQGVRNRRALTSVWNLASALEYASAEDSLSGSTLAIVADGESPSTPRLLTMLSDAMGARVRLFWVPEWMLDLAARAPRAGAAVQRLIGSLDVEVGGDNDAWQWRPSTTQESGLARTAEWFAQGRSE